MANTPAKPGFFRNMLDPYLEGLRPTSVDPTQKLGVSGNQIYGGYVVTPERNPKLTGARRYETYSEMFSNLSIVAAGVRYFLNVITRSSWRIEPPDDTPAARQLAEYMEEMMHDMEIPWHRVVRKAVMYKFYGFSIQEWTAKRRPDGTIGLLTIESRPQRTIEKWDTDSAGLINGVVQRSPQTAEQIYIPRSKCVYLVDDSLTDSPEGFGLFRHMTQASDRLKRYEQLEGYGYETDLRGVPIGRAPIQQLNQMVEDGQITAPQRDAIMAPMESFIKNHVKGPRLGVLLDSLTYQSTNEATTPSNVKTWDIELLKGGSESLHEISAAIQRVNNEIARVLGVESILLGGQGRGSMALSKDKSDNFFVVVDSALKDLASTYTGEIIDKVWLLNGWPAKLKPRFKTDSIQLRDIQDITTALQQMAQAGAILAPDDPAISEVRDLLGLSRPKTDTIANDVSLLDNEDGRND